MSNKIDPLTHTWPDKMPSGWVNRFQGRTNAGSTISRRHDSTSWEIRCGPVVYVRLTTWWDRITGAWLRQLYKFERDYYLTLQARNKEVKKNNDEAH